MIVVAVRPDQILIAGKRPKANDFKATGQLLDTSTNTLFSPVLIQSTLARGYWEAPSKRIDIDKLIRESKPRRVAVQLPPTH